MDSEAELRCISEYIICDFPWLQMITFNLHSEFPGNPGTGFVSKPGDRQDGKSLRIGCLRALGHLEFPPEAGSQLQQSARRQQQANKGGKYLEELQK